LVFLSETLNGEGRSETLRPFWRELVANHVESWFK